MSRKSASLLTKTQRRRIREDFAGLEEAKVRRDQQRIRERLESGILDFELLADYPDRQFELAFDEWPTEPEPPYQNWYVLTRWDRNGNAPPEYARVTVHLPDERIDSETCSD